MRGEALAGGEQPEVGVLERRDLREINNVEACGGAGVVQRRAGSAEGAEAAVVTTAGPREDGTCMACACAHA
jgi:hypothetical protein